MKAHQAFVIALALLQPIEGLDLRVQRAVQERRSPALDRVMQTATDLGRRDVVAGALLGIAVLDPVQGPALARLAIVALVGTNLVVEGLKLAVGRPRPDGERKRSNASFPSGHAASAMCMAWILARRWPRAGVFLWILAAVVAWSRIVLNRHYLSDVVCGAAVGLVCAWAAFQVPGLDPARQAGRRARDPAPGGRADP